MIDPSHQEVAQLMRTLTLARLLSAETMGLIKDPLGTNLPEELWSQKVDQAKKLLDVIRPPRQNPSSR